MCLCYYNFPVHCLNEPAVTGLLKLIFWDNKTAAK